MVDRRTFLLGASALATSALAAPDKTPGRTQTPHDFGFLVGDWHVKHRFLRRGSTGDEWVEGHGACRHQPLDGGWGNVEEYVTYTDRGVNRAVGLRAIDQQGTWSVWWLDERDPLGSMDPAPRGHFANGRATFMADSMLDGRATRQRLTWSDITDHSARWEQAYSFDEGRTWKTNWNMAFRRASARNPISLGSGATTDATTRSPEFDFLVGDWDVHHRRWLPDGSRWVEFDGICRNRPLMEGRGNMEEHFLPAPSGTYRAIALRSYEPATRRWAIRWLDQRYPHGPIDPPDIGRFENGTGSFYSEIQTGGTRVRGRLSWSDITSRSAHWEQAQSKDGGQTWETNWIMEFRRRTA